MKNTCRFYVYILESKIGTYYTGSTNDLDKRIELHNSGKGAKYLRGKGPVKLVYSKWFKTRSKALKTEAAIKSLTRKEKEKIIKAK